MKFTEPWERQKLSFLLERAVSREAMMWKVYVPKKPSSQVTEDTDVSPAQRAEAVRWLTELHGKLLLYPETLVLAVSILDRFLAPIRARPKYLRCIAIACYFLAAKTCEEDECVPSLGDLAGTSGCDCSPSEVRRMERIILDKLDWDLHTATPLDFLHIFHAMILSCRSGFLESRGGGNRSHHLALLTQRLYTCLEKHSLTQQRGSMLALALLSLELESCCPDWLVLTIDLLRKAQMDSSDLIRCRELVSQLLSTQTASLPPNTVYIYHLGTRPGNQDTTTAPLPPPRPLNHHRHLLAAPPRCKASAKRKVEAMEVDDFYDGIKRLYNEDLEGAAAPPTPGGRGGGGGGGERAEARVSRSVPSSRQEGSTSPCPPLQPICAP